MTDIAHAVSILTHGVWVLWGIMSSEVLYMGLCFCDIGTLSSSTNHHILNKWESTSLQSFFKYNHVICLLQKPIHRLFSLNFFVTRFCNYSPFKFLLSKTVVTDKALEDYHAAFWLLPTTKALQSPLVLKNTHKNTVLLNWSAIRQYLNGVLVFRHHLYITF